MAISSLPVPFSPWIRMFASLAGDARDEVEHLVHLLALSDDVAELEPSFELPLQLDVLVAQRAQLERP